MPLERVALIPRCAECETVWLPADEARWQAWLTAHEPPELVFHCPDCAERNSARTDARARDASERTNIGRMKQQARPV
jgi:hypothetical protein